MNYNGKKANSISGNKRKNMKLADELVKMDIKGESKDYVDKLVKNLRQCACPSLYATGMVTGKTTYHGSIYCGCKTCFICNYNRQKQTRQKYAAWFRDNKTLLLLSKNGKQKYATQAQFAQKFQDWKKVEEVEYDLMHLTLTLPHIAERGFNGKKYYFAEIAALFHRLRNENTYFKENVIGGEYGIECTNPENLHIHIHSLLLVKRKQQNRNFLHCELLIDWNKLTVNKEYTREKIELYNYKSLKAGNKMLTDIYVSKLNPKGSTIIGLETIYTKNKGNQKVRSCNWSDDSMIRAVMETISYHFSPTTFDKSDKTFNTELLIELQPVLYKKQLYRKFGVLHGEKSLNLKNEGAAEFEAIEFEAFVDEETGEISSFEKEEEPSICRLISPSYAFCDPQNDFSIHFSKEGLHKSILLNSTSPKLAKMELIERMKESCKRKLNIKNI